MMWGKESKTQKLAKKTEIDQEDQIDNFSESEGSDFENLESPDSEFKEVNIEYDFVALWTLGVLLCKANLNDKAESLFLILQDDFQDNISHNDKDIPIWLNNLVKLSTSMIYKYRLEYKSQDEKPLVKVGLEKKIKEVLEDEF